VSSLTTVQDLTLWSFSFVSLLVAACRARFAARAGLALGADAKKLVTPEQVESIGADTFSYKAIEAQYSLAASDVINRLIPVLNGRTFLVCFFLAVGSCRFACDPVRHKRSAASTGG